MGRPDDRQDHGSALNRLLAQMTPQNQHAEIDFGAPVGHEQLVWTRACPLCRTILHRVYLGEGLWLCSKCGWR